MIDDESICIGFSSSPGSFSSVSWDVEALARDWDLVLVVGTSCSCNLAIGVIPAESSSANSRLLGVFVVSSSEDSPSSTSGTVFMNATRFEGVFCSALSNAESFRFNADLLGDFETERETEEWSRRGGFEGVGFAEDVGV